MTTLLVGRRQTLTVAQVVAFAQSGPERHLALSPESPAAVAAGQALLREWLAAGRPCYGVTTGFGALVDHPAASDGTEQGLGLIHHLCAGFGPLAPDPIVRAMLVIRAHTVAQGYSGIGPGVLADWLALCCDEGLPEVPRYGSVGASGDLIPMAHAVAGWRRREGLQPLTARDALALVNGTALTAAIACDALATATRLLQWACVATAECFAALGVAADHLAPRLHALRGHPDQAEAATAIRHRWTALAGPQKSRPLQEPYSLRCAPAVLGSAFAAVAALGAGTETEINGIADNPVVDVEAGKVWHGGNFHGQRLGSLLDAATAATVQAANLAERQLALLLEPQTNGGLAPLLAGQPGAQSGFAGAQLAATALAAQMRAHTLPLSAQSLPTNLHNQDLVPMSTASGWNLYDRLQDWARLLATELLATAQAAWQAGHSEPGRFTAERVLALGRFDRDVPLYGPLNRLTDHLLTTDAGAC
jgi:tyrosine ammonia-lyase